MRAYPDVPEKKDFWTKVFHNGFKCDYYKKNLDGQSREYLDRIYMQLTQPHYQKDFKSVFEVCLNFDNLFYLNKNLLIAQIFQIRNLTLFY